jgi:hypothetical protein
MDQPETLTKTSACDMPEANHRVVEDVRLQCRLALQLRQRQMA